MLNGCDLYTVQVILVLLVHFTLRFDGITAISIDNSSFFNISPYLSAWSKYVDKSKPGLFSGANKRYASFDINGLSNYIINGTKETRLSKRSFEVNEWIGHYFQQSRQHSSENNFNKNGDQKHSLSRQKRDQGLGNGLSQADVKQLDRKVHSKFYEMFMHCLPVSQPAEKGFYRIYQDNTFEVECDPGKTWPLYSFKTWSCDPTWLLKKNLGIPTQCQKKTLPTLIAMEREVSVYGLKDSDCVHTKGDIEEIQAIWRAQLKKSGKTTFYIERMKFQFAINFSGGECSGVFNDSQQFHVHTKVGVIVTHKPMYFRLRPSTRSKVQAVLDTEVKLMFNTLKLKKKISDYDLNGMALKFEAIECPSASSSVQKDEKFFVSQIPSCRYCQRGMYHDKDAAMCFRCPRGSYANLIGNCLKCPYSVSSRLTSGDSLADCYSAYICPDCIPRTLKEDLFTLGGFHLCLCILLVWNFRDALRSSPTIKDDDNESKTSTTNIRPY